MNEKQKSRRRWFQISLRTMFLLVAVLCIAFGGLGYKMRQAEGRRQAVEAIRKGGGEVMYDYEFQADGQLIEVAEELILPGPAWLRTFFGIDFFADVVRIVCDTDADLAYLREFPQLRSLSVSGRQVSDVGMARLSRLSKLRILRLCQTQISDTALIHLQDLQQLELLNLEDTAVSDSGLMHLRRLTKLKQLFLSHTQVTDEGLIHLQALNDLMFLDLLNTRVTETGQQELNKVLPNLDIQFEEEF